MSNNNNNNKNNDSDLDELLFGPSPSKQQQPQNEAPSASTRTKQQEDDDLAFLLGESPSQKGASQPTTASSSSSPAALNNSINNNNNNNNNNNYHTPTNSPTTRSAPVVTILDESSTSKEKEKENSNKEEEEAKQQEEEDKFKPGTFKEELFWTILHAIPPVTLVIVIFALGYAKTTPGGQCEADFDGSCMPMSTAAGGLGTASIFAQLDIEKDLGCSDASQACISASISLNDLYADSHWTKCAGYSGGVQNNNISNSSSYTGNKIWIVPSLTDCVGADINITKALECCPFLAGGAAGASVLQIVLKAFLGASLDISLNALTAIPAVAWLVNWLVFPLTYLSAKFSSLLIKRQAKRKAETALTRKNSSSHLSAAMLDDTALLAIRPDPASTISNSNNNNKSTSCQNSSSAEKTSNSSLSDDWVVVGEDGRTTTTSGTTSNTNRGSSLENDMEDFDEDFTKVLQHYTEKAERENEQMMKDLQLTSWVDEVCFPSTLMIIKSVSLAIFGVYLSAIETNRDVYANSSTWEKYNAYAANIINGAVFSAWLDIGVQFFAFYTTQEKIFRQSMKIAPLAPTIGMSLYVKFMFSPDKNHPANKFFQYCRAARIGTMICWVCYIAPYVTHICMSFFYYLPQITVYYMTMVGGGGLICCLIVRIFDTYGDNWRADLELQKKLKEKQERRKKKNQQNGNNKNDAGAVVLSDEEMIDDISIAKKSLFWPQVRTFFGRYLLMVMYSILVYYVYSLLCNWAVLLYDNYDRYGGANNYLLATWDELAIRQMSCQILKLRDAIAKGDGATAADMILGYI